MKGYRQMGKPMFDLTSTILTLVLTCIPDNCNANFCALTSFQRLTCECVKSLGQLLKHTSRERLACHSTN